MHKDASISCPQIALRGTGNNNNLMVYSDMKIIKFKYILYLNKQWDPNDLMPQKVV